MQRLFSVGHPAKEHIPALKKLWIEIFGDSPYVIDNFFEKTAETENIFCVFCDNEPVSVMYGIDASVYANGKVYKALYIYAVCTREDFRGQGLMVENLGFLEKKAKERGVSYLFLVPASKELFGLYEKSGFSTAFTHNVKVVKKETYPDFNDEEVKLTYSDYIKIRQKKCFVPQAVLGEKGFNSFYCPVGKEMCCVAFENNSYAVFENQDGDVTVFELFGNEKELLSAVFNITKVNEVTVYEPAECCGEPYGMVKILDNSATFKNGFFGISYGG